MAYLDYPGLAYFKSLLDENYLRIDYEGDTVINSNVTFTEPVDASVKNDWLGQQIDKTYVKDLRPEDDGEVALIYGDNHEKVITIDTAVTQVRSDANEMYPILLCYDANAEVNQISKSVRYGHNVAINPAYGYVYANSYVTKHPTYNRTTSVTTRVEWTNDFRDSVLNPVGQIFEYIDPVSSGGEHRMEFRLYGNPNVAGINTPNVNDETNTISMGVSATRGDSLTFFGYCPSTPIYLENGSTMRKSLTRGDQYGRDIITRDWLNLNGSITGLVHTYMDETVDGAKTFKKTVTINSGDNNNKAGLYVQGNSDVHGNEHVYGTETVDGKLTANGTAEIKGGSGNNPSLTVTGDEKVTGNSSITGNETVNGNISTTNGNISTTNGTVSGKTGVIGSGGLTVNGDETVTGEIYKVINSTPQEYVSYVTNKQETKTTIVNNLIKDKGGLAVDANKNIYVNIGNGLALTSAGKINVDFSQLPPNDVAGIISGMVSPGSGLVVDNTTGKLSVNFSDIDENTKNKIIAGLKMQVPLRSSLTVTVNPNGTGHTNSLNLSFEERVSKPFETIQKAVDWVSSMLALGSFNVYINIADGTYEEAVSLPAVNTASGIVTIQPITANSRTGVIVKPTARASDGFTSFCFSAYSGACRWNIKHITMEYTATASASAGLAGGCAEAAASGAIINLYGCTYKCLLPSNVTEYTGAINSSAVPLGGETYQVRMINADNGGQIHLYPDDLGSEMIFKTSYDRKTYVYPLHACRGGQLYFHRSAVSNNGNYTCAGRCEAFLKLFQAGTTQTYGASGGQVAFVESSSNSVIGPQYEIRTGSYAVLPNSGLLGQASGTNADESTYANVLETSRGCWIS